MTPGNEYLNNYLDTNECTSRGVCSSSPAISALEDLLITFLCQTAYYILKLEDHGASNNKIKYEIVNTLSGLVSVNEFNEKQLFLIVRNGYFLLEDTKKAYKELCQAQKLHPRELKAVPGFNSESTLSKTISAGIKYSELKNKKMSVQQKNFTEILIILLKSVSLNLAKLADFNAFKDDVYHEILNVLNLLNSDKLTADDIKEKIDLLSELDYHLQLKIGELLIKTFGGIKKVMVSHSTRHGKAILVSGNNFFDLLAVLETTKNEDIDVYTHSNLLIVHALNKFREYEHLKGHYGNMTENCIVDFATFPGAILLTKNSRNNREYFYRGRLFSNDYIVQNGVIKVENNDYRPLIEAAKNAKGFSKGKTKPDTTLGYDENVVEEHFKTIIEKLSREEIKRLYIVGINAHLERQKIYFDEFFNNLDEDEFAISFSYSTKKDNVLTLNAGDYIPLVTRLLNKLFSEYSISDDKIVFFFTTCDVMTISSIVLLKNLGADNLYMAPCLPTIINPGVFETFKAEYGIHNTSTAQKDLSDIRKTKSSQ